jgi:C-terminal processing protease CtpA/Prc
MYSTLGDIIAFLFFAKNEDVQSFRYFAELPHGAIDTVFFKVPTRQLEAEVFHGKCYVLINGLTASAAVDFTNAFKQRNRGDIVGQQCLGPVTGTWGNPASFGLKRTGLRVSIATIRYNYDDTFRYERNAIMPDHWVDCTAEDLNSKKDSQLEFVIQLIKDKK